MWRCVWHNAFYAFPGNQTYGLCVANGRCSLCLWTLFITPFIPLYFSSSLSFLAVPQVIRKIRPEVFDASGHLKLWCQFFNIVSDSTIRWYKDEVEIAQIKRRYTLLEFYWPLVLSSASNPNAFINGVIWQHTKYNMMHISIIILLKAYVFCCLLVYCFVFCFSAGDETQVCLTIIRMSKRDCGVYRCTITNDYGKDSTEYLLSAECKSYLCS